MVDQNSEYLVHKNNLQNYQDERLSRKYLAVAVNQNSKQLKYCHQVAAVRSCTTIPSRLE